MSSQQSWQLRWSLLSELVAQAPGKLGRTAIMKLAYFLQTLKGVPLGYDFRLYTYGPFDSDVLNDVGQVESLGALKSQMITFRAGYGYEFTIGSKHDELLALTKNQHQKYQDEIKWVLDQFGQKSAADLELLSTIVFADQEAAQKQNPIPHEELAKSVKQIKQRFSDAYILQRIKELDALGILLGSQPKLP